MNEENKEFTCLLEDHDWILKLAYLAEIFQQLNIVNFCLQGPSKNILICTDKLSVFNKKISIWRTNLEQKNIIMFALFNCEKNFNPVILETIKSHLQAIKIALKHYFHT